MDDRRAGVRDALFARIERELLPEATARVANVPDLDLDGIVLGSRPTSSAFGPKGAERFELGRWDGTRFVPFETRLLLPVDGRLCTSPVPVGFTPVDEYAFRHVNVHYTPITRRIARVEICDYYWTNRREDEVRAAALDFLANGYRARFAGRIGVRSRFLRYPSLFAVPTEVEYLPLSEADGLEREAVAGLLRQAYPGFS